MRLRLLLKYFLKMMNAKTKEEFIKAEDDFQFVREFCRKEKK